VTFRVSPGFTLLEVMIAVAISAVGIVGLLELFSGSARLAGVSARQTEALVIARSLMDQRLWRADLEDADETGTWDEYRWRVEVRPIDPQLGLGEDQETVENESDEYELKEVYVAVSWQVPGGERSLDLVSARITELF